MSDRRPDVSESDPLRDIDARLHAAAGGALVPHVDVADDVHRGRRRLTLHRAAVGVGAVVAATVITVGSLVVVGGSEAPGGDSLVADGPTSDARDTNPPNGPTDGPTRDVPTEPAASATPPEDPRDTQELLADYRDVLAEYLDPFGEHLDRRVTNFQSGGGLGTKLGWSNAGEDGLGLVEVFVSRGWRSQFSLSCSDSTPCTDETLAGIDVRVQVDGTTTSVGVRRDDGSVAVISIDPLFGNNSLVPVSGLDVSPADLARAAADERLSLVTDRQLNDLDESFGLPGSP